MAVSKINGLQPPAAVDTIHISKVRSSKRRVEIDPTLAEDIKKNGVLVPILIRQNGEIVDGQSRYLITKSLGRKTIPYKRLP